MPATSSSLIVLSMVAAMFNGSDRTDIARNTS
jgi:hypothetical protein